MTDDEIDAAIREVTAIQPDSRDRAIFRAGMREAALIVSPCWCGTAVADTIERAAGGEE